MEQEGRTFYALKNSPLTLPCGVRTRKPILDYWWLKDGTPLENSTRIKHSNSNLDLSFERVVEKVDPNVSDQGIYRCSVKFSSGVVLGPPHTVFIVGKDKICLNVTPSPSYIRSVPTCIQYLYVGVFNITLKQLTPRSLYIHI